MTREEILNSEVGKNLLEEFENYTRTRLIGVGKSIFFEDFKKETTFKPNTWILYMDGNKNIVRRIITDEEYATTKAKIPCILDEKYGDWMVKSAVDEDKKKGWNYCLRTATKDEIHMHLFNMAMNKGFAKGVEVMNRGTIIQDMNLNSTAYYPKDDQFFCGGICLYQNGFWAMIKEKPKFMFGGYEVKFKVEPQGIRYNSKTVEVTCKSETGTHYDISQILNFYNRPIKFGKVRVKGYTLNSMDSIGLDVPNNKTIIKDVWEANNDIRNIDEITIGCLTGKYSELCDIFTECSRLLKETK